MIEEETSISARRNCGPRLPLYPHAPITEAVLDIRVRLAPTVAFDQLQTVQAAPYKPFGQPLRFNVQVQLHEGEGASMPSVSHSIDANGLQYSRSDEPFVFQVRRDGFTLNRLFPYQDWVSFKAEASRLWPLYKDALKPEMIELLGLTYVNTLHLPFGAQLEDYFNTFINVPTGLPQQLEDFSLSFLVGDPHSNAQIRISQNGAPRASDGRSTVMMTIQAFKTMNVASNELADEELWAILDELRDAKNTTFEACITDKMRENFI